MPSYVIITVDADVREYPKILNNLLLNPSPYSGWKDVVAHDTKKRLGSRRGSASYGVFESLEEAKKEASILPKNPKYNVMILEVDKSLDQVQKDIDLGKGIPSNFILSITDGRTNQTHTKQNFQEHLNYVLLANDDYDSADIQKFLKRGLKNSSGEKWYVQGVYANREDPQLSEDFFKLQSPTRGFMLIQALDVKKEDKVILPSQIFKLERAFEPTLKHSKSSQDRDPTSDQPERRVTTPADEIYFEKEEKSLKSSPMPKKSALKKAGLFSTTVDQKQKSEKSEVESKPETPSPERGGPK